MNGMDRSDIPSARFPDLLSVKAAIERGKQLAKTYQVVIVELDDIVVKYGRRVYKSEALAMQLVHGAAADVPLPHFHAYFTQTAEDPDGEGRCGYLVMEKVPGIPLIEALPRLDEQSCDNIASQLQTYVSSLRSIDSAGKWGIVGRNGIFHGGLFRYLHRPFTEDVRASSNPCVATCTRDVFEYFAKASEFPSGGRERNITGSASDIDFSRPSMFSHGDLVPENIMVDEASGSITSIIDWERAGWYPYFWDESIASMRLSAYQSARTTSDRWTRIYKLALGNDADRGAVRAFCWAHFYALIGGSEEYGSSVRSP
ncbi:kinase-like protein [Trametes versicolor FP-101664 SS1]|uniref:kinase-like protein n=1 Tax=Trametes versicolor (strain FP-101664) TaxID=717944 RepID=UPI0004623AE1|nr:kinase-like protein [Trametes versicolor FP-101664 SS1]EIW62978.1 kinase-like protein [Trametes versicolor FP-101664 SS1]